MDSELSKLSKSAQVASKTIYEAFKILKENGGQMHGKEVIDKIRERVNFNEWEKNIYEKSGYVRWVAILHFYTIDCIKAGFMRKKKGVWFLTEDGEKAITLGPVKLLENANKLYREWAEINKVKTPKNTSEEEPEIVENQPQFQKANLDQLEEQAISGIKEHIFRKNAYEFQDLVAALLRAMKYHTPFISPKGRDGGIDITAFSDPLGAVAPRIKVQVKHRPQSSIPPTDIRSLMGLLKAGDIGLFVTSGSFSSEAERTARESQIHVRLIDIDNFIELWQEFYHNLNDEEKNILPLYPIYFLGSNE
jgi:restriction system protein